MSSSVTAPSPTSRARLAALSAAFAAVAAIAPTGASAAALPDGAVHATTTCQPWSATAIYVQGDTATEGGVTYLANYWTQGDDPATHNGGAGSGQPWTVTTSCTNSPPPPPPPPADCDPWSSTYKYAKGALVTENGAGYKALAKSKDKDPATNNGPKGSGEPWTTTTACKAPPPPPPPGPLVFGSYKDVTINMDWNTNVISTLVPGTRQPAVSAMPSNQTSATWAFATGECGSESWAGVTPSQLATANIQAWVAAKKTYIISTGGNAGVFTCGSDSGFEKFISTYNSSSLQGIDFDLEGGQSQSVVDNLVARVKAAQANHPTLRFSFTLQTLGGNAANSLNGLGASVMTSIKSQGLTNYYINLMTMDYGGASASVCTLGSGGQCDMGQSAINAAINLHNFYGTPYTQIELTPMVGGNDSPGETFTIANVDTVSAWALSNKIAGVHFWSLDRDIDCAPGSSSPTCNSYGQAGTWGFTNRFLSKLGF